MKFTIKLFNGWFSKETISFFEENRMMVTRVSFLVYTLNVKEEKIEEVKNILRLDHGVQSFS